jgi:hypothetical protein
VPSGRTSHRSGCQPRSDICRIPRLNDLDAFDYVPRADLEHLGHQLEMSAPVLTTLRASVVSAADGLVFAAALRSIGPVGHRHSNFRGVYQFLVERYADRLVASVA